MVRPIVKSEDSEQVTFITRVRFTYPDLANNVMAIPNGGYRSPHLAARLKRAGVLRGAPDLLIALVTPTHPGLFIEMKRTWGGKISENQALVHTALRGQGYLVEVAKGADEAWEIFERYVKQSGAGTWVRR